MRRFVKIETEIKKMGRNKEEVCVIEPKFNITGKDIMRKGGCFYAVLDPETGMWSTDQQDLYRIIDEEVYKYINKNFKEDGFGVIRDASGHDVMPKLIDDSSSGMLINFNKWFNNLPPNHNYIPLDSDLTFLSDEIDASMYRSKRLPYDLLDGDISAYDQLMSVLYDQQNREKLEWAIGSVLAGDSKKIEKMVVIYGKGGTGKSTVLDLIQEIFKGYCGFFVAEELALKSNQFATAAFKDNPLIAIQDDGSLAKIDSPRINEVVSHKITMINEKNTKQYPLRPKAMLFMATNDEVTLHDTNLGITRRLLDVYPTYQLLPVGEYRRLVHQMMNFEVPAIAKHCLDIYQNLGKEYYSKYRPEKMIQKTNYIRNFIYDEFEAIKHDDPIPRNQLFLSFKRYCENMNLHIRMTGLQFGEQVKEYYEECLDYKWLNGKSERNVLSGFKADMFDEDYKVTPKEEVKVEGWLKFDSESTRFDDWCKDKGFKAQYSVKNKRGNDIPEKPWDKVTTTMEDIDRSKLHYIFIPESEGYLRLDFDFKNDKGEKDLEKNIAAANEWPPTYAEISKSGGGVHLYYIYNGDQSELATKTDSGVEIKVTCKTQPIRRKFVKCNDMPPATLQEGMLPKKGKKKVVPEDKVLKNEAQLRNRIGQNLLKMHGSTIQSITFIRNNLKDAYESGITYDVSDMESEVFQLAIHSSNRKDECLALMDEMHFKSKDIEALTNLDDLPVNVMTEKPLTIYDIEIWPNVFIFCWKYVDKNNKTVVPSINPKPEDLKTFFEKTNPMGFNVRKYDNHLCYDAMLGATPYMLYCQSQDIIVHKKQEAFRPMAYGLSYTDIYDYASNPNKMSLKKWEIKLKIHHQENAYPWDEDLPEDKWDEAVEYCCNDVLATEQVFFETQGDYMARLILAKLSGFTPNDTTNKHSQQIIFGDDEHPQSQFIYVDLSKVFPGYKFDQTAKKDKSKYKGYVVGEGGFVWAKPGMYRNVKTFDVASMHPSSLIAMNMFGDKYTKRFKELVQARLAIKHEDRDALKALLGGQLLEFYDEAVSGTGGYTLKDLANALKTVINSVYGLTAASFDNRCRDPRNVDNIVAKRGALFMVDLLEKVTKEWGGEVVHIKTDSIKVVNPSPELEAKIIAYGKDWGYTFEVESEYERFCLVNKAAYIAREKDGEWEGKGDEFIRPYIFKKLFSQEEIELDDLSETKSADKGTLYLDYNENLPDVRSLEKEYDKRYKKFKAGETERDDTEILEDLENEIAKGHNYVFVGRVSAFVPVKPGAGGGELKTLRNGKYSYVEGTTGYRWLETEFIRNSGKDYEIDNSYYEQMEDDVLKDMAQFGDPYRFINDPDYDPQLEKLIAVPEGVDEEVPFDEDKPFMNKPE